MIHNQQVEQSILIPAGASPKSLTAVRSLGGHGVHTVVASSIPTAPAISSKYCDEAIIVPSPWDDLIAYKNALVEIASRPDVEAIIPSLEEDAFLLAKYADEFTDHVAHLWPSFETLRVAHDGKLLAEEAAKIDIPVPETMLFDEVNDWSRKLIIKPRYSILTSEYDDSLDPTECRGKIDPIHPRPGEELTYDEVTAKLSGYPPLVQEYVPIKREYSFRALYDHGEAVATSLKHQVRGKSYAGGASVFCELVRNPELEEMGRRLLDHLDWHGLATVQFIEDARTGEFKLTEINPRMWASIPLDVRGGVDYPYFYWLMALGKMDQIEQSYDEGFAAHILFGEVEYLLSVVRDDYPNAERPPIQRALWDVLRSVYEHPNFYFLTWDDPRPFGRGVLNVLTSAIDNRRGQLFRRETERTERQERTVNQ
ncbi:Predicted ATP-dependent carboligase, ATP-grasp superfamily [Halogranum rubrum]|uniref:Predicted ATP-dependent carboligase, ATP-grasp superfamily n=1 Tax=Halogranum rubrum TaxID=553466 RepID=A0A1I4IRF1_9EURY|nr:ATP-grasp domain-containing protein [Halogranum rubrum]SFL56949.1 Predicted ATP-dependent carboligase, ATP-grasp superfamily [Halogranum rubrum]